MDDLLQSGRPVRQIPHRHHLVGDLQGYVVEVCGHPLPVADDSLDGAHPGGADRVVEEHPHPGGTDHGQLPHRSVGRRGGRAGDRLAVGVQQIQPVGEAVLGAGRVDPDVDRQRRAVGCPAQPVDVGVVHVPCQREGDVVEDRGGGDEPVGLPGPWLAARRAALLGADQHQVESVRPGLLDGRRQQPAADPLDRRVQRHGPGHQVGLGERDRPQRTAEQWPRRERHTRRHGQQQPHRAPVHQRGGLRVRLLDLEGARGRERVPHRQRRVRDRLCADHDAPLGTGDPVLDLQVEDQRLGGVDVGHHDGGRLRPPVGVRRGGGLVAPAGQIADGQ
ncbi:hypothetical protein ACFYPF_07400 [Micromonospora sp. NPDC005223]|uniref:hypothetical protein n=1 Tax=unclassified Micromonospora TaxID=2617518 RepID=UPI0033D88241